MKTQQKSKDVKRRPLTFKSIPEDLIWALKEKAAAEHMTLTAFVIQALRRAVEEEEKK